MPRTANASACGPRPLSTGPRPSAIGSAVCCGAGTRLTRRRVVDLGLAVTMRCC
ncbi:hypothetical protein [Streptomyces sp. GESEQ-35]|uniref:hypothetical protein n=1 Tax=Streptomyces sp. GESEQ-35 TaxID=2812657 RepID=UPI001B336A67|nr:hypothetical protein [Streptomyces sp. GESEQ-35]